MATIVGSLLRAATRKENDKLNILTFSTHERYQSGLALTGYNFYLYQADGIKEWKNQYAPLPKNHILLPNVGQADENNILTPIPLELDIDLVLAQHKFGQFQIGSAMAQRLGIPLISLEHTLPMPGWPQAKLDALRSMQGSINIFISEFSRKHWGWDESNARVIHHGVDTELFKPGILLGRTLVENQHSKYILSVVNDWINRDIFCGFKLWQEVTQGLPVKVVGDTPGLSKPAASVGELVGEYQRAHIFLNTSLVSPVPTSLLEAMACGCACVSTDTCMIPEVITHGLNGLLAKNPKEMRRYLEELMRDDKLARSLGSAARQTIVQRFSMDKFVQKWKEIFDETQSNA
jgi:glycosyltransferase involved in cell wall biosynthesis